MSVAVSSRKRARKACLPCQQRKRKCDAQYPCSMCTTYGYDCNYTNTSKRIRLNGETNATNQGIRNLQRPAPQSEMTGNAGEAEHHLRSPYVAASASNATGTPTDIGDDPPSTNAGSPAITAFPHVLGVALGSDRPPRVHSFAFNFGIRSEEASGTHGLLKDLISEDDLGSYSEIYFSALAPVGDFIDPRIYTQRCRVHFRESKNTASAFGAVAAGIAALGSFLSSHRHARESELVQYAKTILEDPVSMQTLDVDHIIAWGLRTFYLRATTRPSIAWIASCTQLHLCEALGLHDEEKIQAIASVEGAATLGNDEDRLRRIFWIAWAGHNILSYEFDRSSVHFRSITCQAIMPAYGSIADQFVRMAQIIPSSQSPFQLDVRPPTLREELSERLKTLNRLQVTDPFLVLTKADLAFCFYRRIYQLKMGVPDEVIQVVINSGNAAVKAAEQLVKKKQLFWNVIGSVFQYACILLAIDTSAALAHVPATFQCLESLQKAADTELTREALSIAKQLLSLSTEKKRRDLTLLEPLETIDQALEAQDITTTPVDSGIGFDFDWDQFLLEPYLSMFSHDVLPQ